MSGPKAKNLPRPKGPSTSTGASKRTLLLLPTMKSGKNVPPFREVVAFATIGVTGTGLYAAVVLMLTQLGGVNLFLANHLAIIASATWSYFGHRWITFAYNAAHAPAIRRFLAQLVILYIISNGLLMAANRLGLDSIWGVAATVTLNPAINYFALKFWVFRHA
jgi:putative flippase GtrA